MPSSPEPVTPWELDDLRAAPSLSAVGSSPSFTVDEVPAREPVLFEVGTRVGVPDRLLADARSAAQASGYLAGWAAGLQAAESRARAEARRQTAAAAQQRTEQRAEYQRAVAALDAAAAELERRALPGAAELEELIVATALAVAEEVVGHALTDDAVRAPSALARVLALAPVDEDVEVRMAVADIAVLEAEAGPTATPMTTPSGRALALVADPTLRPGDAVAISGATQVDARIGAALARVRAVLDR